MSFIPLTPACTTTHAHVHSHAFENTLYVLCEYIYMREFIHKNIILVKQVLLATHICECGLTTLEYTATKKKRLAILPSKYMHNSIYKHYIMNMLDAKCRMRHNTTGHPTTNNKNDDNNNDDEIAHTHLYRHVMHSFCLFFTKLITRAQKTLCCGAMQPKWLFSLFACRWSRCTRLVLSAS